MSRSKLQLKVALFIVGLMLALSTLACEFGDVMDLSCSADINSEHCDGTYDDGIRD